GSILPGAPGHLDASLTIPVLDVPVGKVDRSMGDIHPAGNPHYWIPPDNALLIARAIAERLKSLDAGGPAAYARNLAACEPGLARGRAGWEACVAPLRGSKIVTYHKSWSYVSRWLGLVEDGYVEPKPGIPASPQHIAQLINRMRAGSINLILMESFYPR